MNQTLKPAAPALFAALILASTGCTTTAPEAEQTVRIETAQELYEVAAGATEVAVEVTLTNATGDTLWLDGVERDLESVERRVGNEWQVAYRPAYTMQLVEPVAFPPGETRQQIARLNLDPGVQPLLEDPHGRYRLVYGYLQGAERAGRTAYSNEFQIVAD